MSHTARKIIEKPYKDEVALGHILGEYTNNKFGYNLDIDTGTEEIIASFGGAFDPLTDIITTAQTFTIAYDNTQDGLGQAGATMLQITYLDENFKSQVAIHVLGSSGSDVTAFTGLGINRVVCIAFGSTAFNQADITITATTDTTTQAQIPAESSVTQQCIFHTQINHTFLASWLYFNALKLSGGSAPRLTIKGYSFSRVTLGRYQIYEAKMDTDISNEINLVPPEPFVLSGREVLYFTATTDTNNTEISCRFSGREELS